jgi:hypothetical protein
VHKVSEHELAAATISAATPDQAIKRVIQIVNGSLERSTSSVEPFQEARI